MNLEEAELKMVYTTMIHPTKHSLLIFSKKQNRGIRKFILFPWSYAATAASKAIA